MTLAPESTDGSADIRRRLAEVAATTTLDPEAWDRIQDRAAAASRRAHRRPLVAAVAVALIVVVMALVQHDRGSQVRTDDDRTTTTTVDRTTTTTTTTTTSTTLPTAPADGVARPGASPGGGPGTGDATGTGGGTAAGGGAGGAGTSSGGDGTGGSAAPATPAPTTPAAPTAPDGLVPTVRLATADYELAVTVGQDAAGAYRLNVWRDTVAVASWSWAVRPNGNCLGGTRQDVGFADTPTHALAWGLVRADAASVRLVSTSQIMARAQLGPEVVPGLRAWIGEQPYGQLARVEARGAADEVLHAAAASSELVALPDAC